MALVLAACGSKTTSSDAQGSQTVQTEVTEESKPTSTNTDLFTDRDLDPSYDEATTIDLSKESSSKVTISKAGTYVLTGTYNGQVVVKVGDEDKVQLVLDNVTIANNNSAAIYVASGDKVFVTLKDGTTNRISSSATFSSADAETGDNIDAAIWSKATLTFNGDGKHHHGQRRQESSGRQGQCLHPRRRPEPHGRERRHPHEQRGRGRQRLRLHRRRHHHHRLRRRRHPCGDRPHDRGRRHQHHEVL